MFKNLWMQYLLTVNKFLVDSGRPRESHKVRLDSSWSWPFVGPHILVRQGQILVNTWEVTTSTNSAFLHYNRSLGTRNFVKASRK